MQLGNAGGSSYKGKQVSERLALSPVEWISSPSFPSNSKTHQAVIECLLHLCGCLLPSGFLTKEFICTVENGDHGTNWKCFKKKIKHPSSCRPQQFSSRLVLLPAWAVAVISNSQTDIKHSSFGMDNRLLIHWKDFYIFSCTVQNASFLLESKWQILLHQSFAGCLRKLKNTVTREWLGGF